MCNTKEFYENIKLSVPQIECKNIVDIKICLPSEQLKMLEKLFITWGKDDMSAEVENLLNDILKQPNNQNGKVYEALVYA